MTNMRRSPRQLRPLDSKRGPPVHRPRIPCRSRRGVPRTRAPVRRIVLLNRCVTLPHLLRRAMPTRRRRHLELQHWPLKPEHRARRRAVRLLHSPSSPPTPAAPPRSSARVDPFPTQSSAARTANAPPERGGKVLLPGGQAWKAPSKKSDPAAPRQQTASASPPPRLQPRPPAPAPQPKSEGIIYWTGTLKKNQTIVIEGTEATAGFADGDLLPGNAVDVHIPSPAVALVERPTPRNGWKRVAFRCLRSTKRSVTLNIQWRMLP